ncbi:phage distal tail protein [Olsenella phocaeensis]|uniref:phage distal tail protein n=1 Tax=Olsenella phocaeensis TaxID=1852385 RepID=UPI003A8C8C20
MSSITYGGHDFSDCTTCEVIEGPHAVVPTAKVVPGRAGELLLGSRLVPRIVRVRLFLDAREALDEAGLSALKRRICSWLYAPDGGVLVLPGYPGLEWHDAVVTAASPWSSVTGDASCDVTFTCYDPVAYGASRTSDGTSFTVGGTWATWPVFIVEAAAGSAVEVGCGGAFVRVEHEFIGGEDVIIDCGRETVTLDGIDARADVSLSSDFFCLEPGQVELTFSGCSSHVVVWRERWL